MSEPRLVPSPRVAEGDWIARRLRPFASGVAAVVPDGFPAYVRILHPARGADGSFVTWAGVAEWSGRRMHRLAQFHAISRPLPSAESGPRPWDGHGPRSGELPPDLLRILCEILARHTTTPDGCWFCLWEGYGWVSGGPARVLTFGGTAGHRALRGGCLGSGLALRRRRITSPPVPPAFPPEVMRGPRVRLPGRDYLLFEGPLAAATEMGWTTPRGDFFPQSPNLFWPQDHAWCVASEIDLFCTLVAGSQALAEALLSDPRLEAWEVRPEDPINADSDEINI